MQASRYHKGTVRRWSLSMRADTGDEDDEDDEKVEVKQSRWLVSGEKDYRAVIWEELMDFNLNANRVTIK